MTNLVVPEIMRNLKTRRTGLWGLFFYLAGIAFSQASVTISPIQLTQLHYTLQNPEQVLTPALDESPAAADPRKADYWVVTFMSARCPCSGAHEERMKNLARKFGGPKFAFIGVHANADETREEARAHFVQSKLPFRLIEDTQNQWINTLGALKTPHSYVIEARTGRVLYQGGIDDSSHPTTSSRFFLSEVLEDIQAGKAPRIEVSRALGCQIKRR